MGLNKLLTWEGKTLRQWTADIANFCKGSGERHCSGTDSIETLQWKMEMNWRCLIARAAVQYFYDPPETEEEKRLHNTHVLARQEAAAAYNNCHTLLMNKYREERNIIKKAFNLLQVEREQGKHTPKVEAKDKKGWVELIGALSSDTIRAAIDKKTGRLDPTLLKRQEAVLTIMEKTAAAWDVRKIEFRK